MPAVATSTKLPLNDHLVLLRKKGVLKRSSDKTPEPLQDQGWKIIRKDAASLWGFQETPTARTAVREGKAQTFSVHSQSSELVVGREVSKARLKGGIWYFWGASLSPHIAEEVGEPFMWSEA